MNMRKPRHKEGVDTIGPSKKKLEVKSKEETLEEWFHFVLII